jgi:glutathione synthetase
MQTQEQKDLIQNAIEQAKLHGILKYLTEGELTHAPFSLSPYTMTESVFEEMTELTVPFSELMIRVSRNTDFLAHHLEPIAAIDPFLKMLLDCRSREITQSRQLLVQRNDFFIANVKQYNDKQNSPPAKNINGGAVLRQVELNTVSASFPFLITKLNQLHKNLFEQNMLPEVVQNNPLDAVVDAFAHAVQNYGKSDCVMLVIVQHDEKNIFDQLGLEQHLWVKYKIATVRKTLTEIHADGKLRQGHLVVDGKTVAVTYYRAGYTPDDFPSQEAFKGRQLIEASSTIQVPDLAMQLSGMKKIQQVLTKKEVLEDFVSEEISGRFLKTFAKMHTLDEIINTPEGEFTASKWLSCHADDYVLKPQREGGGNNYFGSDILNLIPTIKKEEQKAYIMMEKIKAVPHSSIQIVNGNAETLNCVSEVGRFGVCFAENGKIKNNLDAGYLVRTKAINVNEGGVSAGFACLNTIKCFD